MAATQKSSRLALLFRTVLPVFVILAGTSSCLKAHNEDVRPPAFAGTFYPESPVKLRGAVDSFLVEAIPGGRENPVAILAPHAGYIFSGQICADAYAQIQRDSVDLVVILGTNHTSPGFDTIAVHPGSGFRTPLGVAWIDRAAAAALLKDSPDCIADASVHGQEHSVEVQIPFIQVLFPRAKILPVVVGSPDPALCNRFGTVLARIVRHRRVLIVASSDLSHYPAYDDAVRIDTATLDALLTLDPTAFHAAVGAHHGHAVTGLTTAACGEGPILVALAAARHLGARRATIVSYANSGDTSVGDRDRVVGYGAVAFTGGNAAAGMNALKPATPGSGTEDIIGSAAAPMKDFTLAREDRTALLRFARNTISRFLDTETTPLARGFGENARRQRGVFVTLKKDGVLRGCIGQMTPDAPLCILVGRTALKSAFDDPRFPPLTREELKDVEIEISVLTPFRPVASAAAIVVGRDGVVLRKGERTAVFLPQVAPEQGWGKEEMLDHLCRKAGLEAGAWRKGAALYTFQADVFGERDAP